MVASLLEQLKVGAVAVLTTGRQCGRKGGEENGSQVSLTHRC